MISKNFEFSLCLQELKSNLIIPKNFEFSQHTAEFGIQLAREPFRHSLTGYDFEFSRHTAEFGIQLAREPFRHSLTGYGS